MAAINRSEMTASARGRNMYFAVKQGGAIRLRWPPVSIRAVAGDRMREVLCDPANLTQLYKRNLERVDYRNYGDRHVCFLSAEGPGLEWRYTRSLADETFETIRRMIGIEMTAQETIFLRNVLLPFLPDEFFGLTDGLHTIKKMGEFQGPDYETIKKRIPPSLEEIRDKLMHVTKKDDISAYFNKRLTVRFTLESVPDPVFNYLAEFTEETGPSIFKQIKALLASPQGESK